jgi:predicted aldo/keto reductase-like oxidoreductase
MRSRQVAGKTLTQLFRCPSLLIAPTLLPLDAGTSREYSEAVFSIRDDDYCQPKLSFKMEVTMPRSSGYSRRTFLRCSLLAPWATLHSHGQQIVPSTAASPLNRLKILNYQPGMNYRRVGNTEIALSVISLGGLVITESVHHYAIDRGVNLVHMSIDYSGGQAAQMLAKVLKSKRDRVYVALKADFSSLEEALRHLNIDYADFLMFPRHGAGAASDPRIPEIFEDYQKQGKVRFAGLTSHGQVKKATAAGIQSGFYTLVMPSLSQPNFEAMGPELQAAYDKGVGVMAMKTMKGMGNPDLQKAYVKKLLSHPGITTINKGIRTFEMFDAYLEASQEVLSSIEDQALKRYAKTNRSENCMMCDACRQACPSRVEISTVLRSRDYYYEQCGDMATALLTYQGIPVGKRGSAECRRCRVCESVCPNAIRIVERLEAARELFERV